MKNLDRVWIGGFLLSILETIPDGNISDIGIFILMLSFVIFLFCMLRGVMK